MAADFGFVTHAAERNPDKLAASRMADGHRQGSLAHAGRSDEAENRALGILHQLAYGKKLEDALFDLVEAVVFFIQDLFRGFDVANFLRFLFPRYCEQPIEIIAADRGLRGHRRHKLQALQLLDGLLMDFLGHPGGVDLLFQLVDFVLLAAPQFFLNGLKLFVQVVLFLCPLHLALHARIDVAVDIQLFQLDFQDVADAIQPLEGINGFEQILLFIHRQLQVGGNRIRQARRIIHPRGGNHGVVIQALRKLDELFVQRGDFLNGLLDLRRWLDTRTQEPNRGTEEPFLRGDREGPRPLHAFDQNFDVAIGKLDALHDVGESAHGVDLFRFGVINRSVVLRGKKDLFVAGQRFLKRADARFAAHDKGGHLLRKNDHIAHRHHGHALHFLFFASEHSVPWILLVWPGTAAHEQRSPNGLSGLLEQTPIDFAGADHVRGNHEVAHLPLHGQVVHQFQHEVFEDHSQAARADLALKCQLRHSLQRVVRKSQPHVFEFEQPLVLFQQRVLRFRQYLDERAFVQIVHDPRDRQAADKFRDQAVADQIARLDLFEQFGVAFLWRRRRSIRVEAQRAPPGALLDNFFQAYERSAAEKKNVRGVHRSKFLMGMLTATLRRHIGNRAFQYLQQRLLHAFAGNVAGDRRVLVFFGNLVDLIDINDALLRLLDVAVRRLQQFQNNVFDVFAHVARFGKRRGIDDRERHIQHARQRLRQQCLARAGRADQQDIGLAQFDFARLLV